MKDKLIGKKLEKGFSTIELLIAFVILIITLTSVVQITFGNQSVSSDSQTNNEAVFMAQRQLEDIRASASLDFNLVNSVPESNSSVYTKKVEVSNIDFFTKNVTSNVSWKMGTRNLSINFSTLITNPEAIGGGDTCNSTLEGDWTNLQKTEYEFGADILNDTSSGFPITNIQSFNHKMYVTVNNNNGNNPGTFFILDISNPENMPVLLSPAGFDNSPVGEGLNGVAVDGGDYAYVASAYTSAPNNCVEGANCAQLQVIDISDSSAPQFVKNLKIPSITTGNKLAAGTSIFYKDGIVYLGLAKARNGSDEFYTIDVGGAGVGSPTNPVILDSEKIDNGVNAIFVKGDYAYVASPNNQELKIFDISTPNSISQVGGFDAPGGGGNNGNGKSLYLVGNKLYLGRTLLNGNEFYVLNNSNPETNLPSLASKNIENNGSITSVNGIIVRNNLLFLITNEEFQTWDLSNLASNTPYAPHLTLPPGSGGGLQGTASDCEGNYIFVGSQSSNDKGYISVITGS